MNPFQSDNIWKKKARQGKAQQHPLTAQQEWQKQVNSSSLWLGGGVVLLALYLAAIRTGAVALDASAAVLIVVVGFLGKVLKLDGVEETSLIYSNAGNLIIPIVTAILGKEWVIYTSAFLSVQLFLLWSHAKMKLCGEKGIDLKKILTNINMIAIFAGVLAALP